ncbi:MAG: glycosyltransferase [Deltaproteobacteria bacterium]|nr:glycosyltransferase [Deltaproteobacteria bacterium]
MKPSQPSIDVSLVLAVSDAEETLGRDIKAFAAHMTALGLGFEIVAVNDGSRDNSLGLLKLLECQIPELRVIYRDVSGRAFVRGTSEARGQTVILADTANCPLTWAPLGWALGRLEAGKDAVVLRSRYVVARRLTCLPAVARSRGTSAAFERRFESESQGLSLEVVGSRRASNVFADVADMLRAPLRRLPFALPRF